MKKLISQISLKAANLAIAFDPKFAPAWKLKAKVEQSLFKYDEAIASYEKYVELCPQDFEALTVIGALFNTLGQAENAIEFFDRAIAIKPHYQRAWLNKGYACSRLARYEDAIAAYDQVLEIDSNHYQALVNKGHSWQFLGQHEKAIACYSDVIAAHPDDLTCRMHIRRCQTNIRLLCQKEEFLASEEYLNAKYK